MGADFVRVHAQLVGVVCSADQAGVAHAVDPLFAEPRGLALGPIDLCIGDYVLAQRAAVPAGQRLVEGAEAEALAAAINDAVRAAQRAAAGGKGRG